MCWKIYPLQIEHYDDVNHSIIYCEMPVFYDKPLGDCLVCLRDERVNKLNNSFSWKLVVVVFIVEVFQIDLTVFTKRLLTENFIENPVFESTSFTGIFHFSF